VQVHVNLSELVPILAVRLPNNEKHKHHQPCAAAYLALHKRLAAMSRATGIVDLDFEISVRVHSRHNTGRVYASGLSGSSERIVVNSECMARKPGYRSSAWLQPSPKLSCTIDILQTVQDGTRQGQCIDLACAGQSSAVARCQYRPCYWAKLRRRCPRH
jgi:hypothetical protein